MFQPSILAIPWALSAIALLLIEGTLIWTRPLDLTALDLRLAPLTFLVVLNAAMRAAWVAAQYALAMWPLPEFRRRHDAFFFREEEAAATTTRSVTQGRAAAVVACAVLWSLQMLAVLAWFCAELVVRGGDEAVGAMLSWVLPPMVGWLVVVFAMATYCGLGVYILLIGGRTCLFVLRRTGWGGTGPAQYMELT